MLKCSSQPELVVTHRACWWDDGMAVSFRLQHPNLVATYVRRWSCFFFSSQAVQTFQIPIFHGRITHYCYECRSVRRPSEVTREQLVGVICVDLS